MTAPVDNLAGKMPTASGLPLLGSALPLLRDPLAFLQDQYAQHGPVFRIRSPGRNFVVLAGIEANRFASREGRDVFLAAPFWQKLSETRQCPHLLLGVDGDDHKTLRKLHGRDLPKSLVDEHAAGLVALTRAQLEIAADGEFRPAVDLARTLVSRQVHHMLSGGAEPAPDATIEALMQTFRWETNTLLLGKWPKLALKHPRYRQFERTAREFLDALIDDSGANRPPGWFATTLKGRSEHPRLFTDGDVRVDFMLPFVAGVDTVGATLASMLGELLQRPMLVDEIATTIAAVWPDPGTPPRVAELREVDALRGAVLETLRLHPSAFAVYRQAGEDFDFAGHRVKAGEDVLLFTTATHGEDEHFADAETFDVTRYSPPRDEHRKPFAHMPYGVGPHICLGAGLGESLLLLTAAVVFRFYDVAGRGLEHAGTHRYDPSLVVDERFEVTLRKQAQ